MMYNIPAQITSAMCVNDYHELLQHSGTSAVPNGLEINSQNEYNSLMARYNAKPGVDWNLIRADFTDGLSLSECVRRQCERGVDITKKAIQKRRDKEGWDAKSAATKVPSVIAQATGLATTTIRTPERAKTIVDLFTKGLPQKTVARLAGIAESTLIDWRKEDPALDELCDTAAEQWHAGMVGHIDSAAPRDWKAAQWRLQTHHRTKQDYAEKERGGTQINVMVQIDRSKDDGITISGTAEKL